jgi:TolB-like protein/DNA-binding winged helix-turn-helix (wHTH) protein/Flp pilus assembly protein TadD
MVPQRVRFAGREFDPNEGVLLHGTARVVLSPREAATLWALVQGEGGLVDKQTLMREVWGDLAVEENNLNQQISHLRRVLGARDDGEPLIETVPRRGYRLTVPVEAAPAATPSPVAPASNRAAIGPSAIWIGAAVAVAAVAWWAWSARSAATPVVHTVLVLPFQNLTGDSASDYLAEGITDEITTELARVAPGSLRVIARTSAVRLRGSTDGLRAIARRVGADLVVEGSLRRDGDVLRVTARLSDAGSETQVWAQSYDQPLEGVLAVQRKLAQSVANTVSVAMVEPAAVSEAVPPDARDAYLRARYFHTLATVPSIERAIEAYERALAIAPSYAKARAGLARAYIFGTRMEPRLALGRARELAAEARRVDPSLPEAQLAWAMARFYADREFEDADVEFRRAIAMDPGAADPHFYHAQLLTAAGRFDEALAAGQRALAIDPYSPLIHHYVGRILFFARRPQQAISHLLKTIEIDPNYAWTRMFLAVAYEQAGDYENALDQRQRYWALMGVPPARVSGLREVYDRDGYAGVRRAWMEWIAGFERQRGFATSTELGLLHAALGEPDIAIDALNRAADAGVRDLVYLRVYPELDPLRSDPRFETLLARVFSAGAPGRAGK